MPNAQHDDARDVGRWHGCEVLLDSIFANVFGGYNHHYEALETVLHRLESS